MTDYEMMLEAFGVTNKKAVEIQDLVLKIMKESYNRDVVCKTLTVTIRDWSINEQRLAFYLWGSNEGYSDGLIERASWNKVE